MNRTLKDATVKRYHYDTPDQLRTHLQLFVDACNHARRLKTLRGLTPYEAICQIWTKQPERFRINPSHHIPGPYNEIATRTEIALHDSVSDYHTSGVWNALGCAAIVARALNLDAGQTHHALGIAEYHGLRSQMMRCVDHPTMVKDGSGWGALAGVSAAYLAAEGFTGAPALLLDGRSDLWGSLGRRWAILEQVPQALSRLPLGAARCRSGGRASGRKDRAGPYR